VTPDRHLPVAVVLVARLRGPFRRGHHGTEWPVLGGSNVQVAVAIYAVGWEGRILKQKGITCLGKWEMNEARRDTIDDN
jgi:hypothetical protein